MTMTFRCDDKDTLVAYLYDEIDSDQRRHVEAHLRTCLACLTEVESLRHVRQDLAAWQPPEARLNFQVSQQPATVLRPSRWSLPPLPGWAQAAAAVLLFATGLHIANVHVRYGSEGLSVSTGWMAPRAPAAAAPTPVGVNSSAQAEDWRPVVAALERDLRQELRMVRSTASEPTARTVAAPNVDTQALMRRVEALVSESEQRQQRELAGRMMQFARDFEVQRRVDLRNIRNGFGQLEGRTNMMEGSQRDMLNLVRRVNTGQ